MIVKLFFFLLGALTMLGLILYLASTLTKQGTAERKRLSRSSGTGFLPPLGTGGEGEGEGGGR